MSALETFEKLLAQGKDNALLRFSLGNECHKAGRLDDAIVHLRAALAFDPRYSAAWKLLGKFQTEAGQSQDALDTYRQGIAAAQEKGDIQAVKEMQVFAKRLEKQLAPPDTPTPG
ncbi:MAG: tetratricopeptide repeat protein [Pseudomonadota bacterium]